MRTATEPVPFSWCGARANASRRAASSGSLASTRARSRSPSAALAAAAAASGATPSAHQALGDDVDPDRSEVDPNAARRDRDQVVRHEVAQDHEHRRRRRLLDRLQHERRTLGPQQVELVEDQHLAVAFGRGERGQPDDLAGLLGGDRRAGASDLPHVGMSARQDEASVALFGIFTAGDHPCGERPRRLQLGRAGGADEQVRVDGSAVGGGAQLRDRRCPGRRRRPRSDPARQTSEIDSVGRRARL